MPKGPMAEFGYSRAFAERYELAEKIGKGASCTVHVATDRQTGERVAVKVMPKRFGPDGFLERQFARRVRNEVDIASHLGRSLNVCYFHGAFETDAAVQLVLEHLTGGQLWERAQQGTYSERAAARIIRDVVRTVAQCHSKNIMMRDIKPQNFMFATPDDKAPLKAVDFGISVFCRPGQYLASKAGTRIVMAPEVVRERYTLSADLWSVGVMAYLLLTGRLPFPFWDTMYVKRQAVTEKDLYNDICSAPLDFESSPWDSLSDEARDFVSALLNRNEAQRPTAEQALQHRWLAADEHHPGADVPLGSSIVQRLQRFGTYGRLKRAALHAIARFVPPDNITVQELRGLFLELDPLDTGCVPYTRLQQEMEEGMFELSAAECGRLLATMDINKDGEVDFYEFLAALMDWSKLQQSTDWLDMVDAAYESLDRDGCGRIGPKDLEILLCGDGGCEAADWLDMVLREADVKHTDNHITQEEFRRLMSSEMYANLQLFESRISGRGSRDGFGSVLGSMGGSGSHD
ncbi:calcium-dependent kinase 29-like [Chlorella sorokiniana]|uniref:Calcium-dependent kinase 29-like n=1 Tax=Chlorella sorokiniana TaxID=3076 RepID=A0A2P6TUX1_CHLSO|nr:calcium-dependent kinase 29-like [Chlorella sorokiniana]|eukprot:PRW57858.1 calcium-dependent kinase 29-like [Chlorella sorokiniana]